MRLSKATLAAALALACAVPCASAAGVAAVTVKSALYEPLRADVRVVLGPDDDYSASAIKIASRERFAAAGVPYPQGAGTFSLAYERTSGRSREAVLRLTSSLPVYEPVLRLVLEARLADNSYAYLPVTLMLDSAFERPLDSGSLRASLPAGLATRDAKATKSSPAPAKKTASETRLKTAKRPSPAQPPSKAAPAAASSAQTGAPQASAANAAAMATASEPKPNAAPDSSSGPEASGAGPSSVEGAAASTLNSAAPAGVVPAVGPADVSPNTAAPATTAAPPAAAAAVSIPAEPAESSWMDALFEFWPFLAGAGVLGCLGVLLASRRKQKAASAQSIDTYADGSRSNEPSTPSNASDFADMGPPTEAFTDFGPASRHSAPFGSRGSIDDLQAQIFSDDPMASLAEAIDKEALIDSVDTRGYDSRAQLAKPVEPPEPDFDPNFGMHFELPSLDEPAHGAPDPQPQPGFDPGLTLPEEAPMDFAPTFDLSKPDRAEPLAFEAPSSFDASADFDASPISIDAFDLEPSPPASAASDNFNQSIAMAQAIQARSSGAPMFEIDSNLGDVHGRVQLELACLYAQAGVWEEASASLKEVLSDEEMAPAHAEARRLLALIP
jgi:hypothetical protein